MGCSTSSESLSEGESEFSTPPVSVSPNKQLGKVSIKHSLIHVCQCLGNKNIKLRKYLVCIKKPVSATRYPVPCFINWIPGPNLLALLNGKQFLCLL